MDIELLKNHLSLTQREIAIKLGTSQTNVRYWLKKHGLSVNRPPGPRSTVVIDDNGQRQCTACREHKADSHFYPNGKKRHTRCRTCLTEDTVERQRAFKAKCVAYKGGKCQICGYDRYQGGFDFHHLDPAEKDFSIAKVTKLHFGEAIFAELDKCALLCANCHREVHGGIATVPE